MKTSYKKKRGKQAKKRAKKITADDIDAAMVCDEPTPGGVGKKGEAGRRLRPSLSTKIDVIKKPKPSNRKKLQRGVQGAANLARHKLSQQILKTSQKNKAAPPEADLVHQLAMDLGLKL